MDFKIFAFLTFVATHAITAAPTEERNQTYGEDSQLEKVFAHSPARMIIAGYLSRNDLKNIAEIPVMSECANIVLNRRSRILHYRDGIINPPYLAKAYELEYQQNFTDIDDKWRFWGHHWTPQLFVMFGSENPMNLIGGTICRDILMVVPKKNHLTIFKEMLLFEENERALREVMTGEGGPMNGVIIPLHLSPKIAFFQQIMRISLADDDNPFHMYSEKDKYQVKLAILINNEDEDQEVARKRGINVAEIIDRDLNTSTCVIAQADTRSSEEKLREVSEGLLLLFHNTETHASTLVVDAEDTNETLRSKFEDWKVGHSKCFNGLFVAVSRKTD